MLLGLAGSKRSGKSSSAKFVLGTIMKQNDVIDKFLVNENADLLVNAIYKNEDDTTYEDMGIFDIDRADVDFLTYMQEMVWPHAKVYNFADNLKWVAINLYGVEHRQLYGTSEEKQEEIDIKWKQIVDLIPKAIKPSHINKDVKLTSREFVQRLGDILRWIDDDCFIKSLMQKILLEQCPFGIIADVRSVNEVNAIKAMGGKVIYHTRYITDSDGHRTETGFADVDKSIFDFVIDNRVCTMAEKNDILYAKLKEWTWVN